jgi:hypothetical protein
LTSGGKWPKKKIGAWRLPVCGLGTPVRRSPAAGACSLRQIAHKEEKEEEVWQLVR